MLKTIISFTISLLATAGIAHAQTQLTIRTSMGDIPITLFDSQAPITVNNFLGYVTRGDYDDVIFHRLVQDFVLQAGGYQVTDSSQTNFLEAITTQAPIVNEYGISNTRGTLAMAKLSGNPDSANSQWFINLNDNSANLDNQNGGFTVFGEVDDFTVVDQIVTSSIVDGGGAFSSVPVNTTDTSNLTRDDLIKINEIVITSSDAIPEPSSTLLIALASATCLTRRKRT